MPAFVAELVGTMILVIFGDGVVANVVLRRTKGNDGGWIVITTGWGLAVDARGLLRRTHLGSASQPRGDDRSRRRSGSSNGRWWGPTSRLR